MGVRNDGGFSMTIENKFFEYFQHRFFDPTTYRGHHFFQHSRYTLENVKYLLIFIAENDNLIAPPGDRIDYEVDGKHANLAANFRPYLDLIVQYKRYFNKRGDQFNSLKKLMFPDMESMQLIKRERLSGGGFRITITLKGLEMIAEKNDVNLQMKWARSILTKIQHISPSFVESFSELLEKISYVSEEELIYFVSYLDYDNFYDSEKIALLIEYSREFKVDFVIFKEEIKKLSNITLKNESLKKTEKFDFGNFSNSTRSLWNYLQELIYFELNNEQVIPKLYLRESVKYLEKEISFRRNPKIKYEYNKEHNIAEGNDVFFDYHHIVPLFFAGSIEEKIMLDDWRNIICIDQNTHAKLTRKNKNNIKLLFLENLMLVDIYNLSDDKVLLTDGVNSKFDEVIIKNITIPFNENILNKMGY